MSGNVSDLPIRYKRAVFTQKKLDRINFRSGNGGRVVRNPPGPAVIKLFGVHFRARVEFLLQISKIGGHQQNVHISSTILCSTRDSGAVCMSHTYAMSVKAL